MRWLVARVVVILLMALGSLWVPQTRQAFGVGELLASGIGAFVATVVVLGFQLVLRNKAIDWSPPDWRANPFSFRRPLGLFDFAAIAFVVSGALRLTVDPASRASIGDAAMVVCAGPGVWLGARVIGRIAGWRAAVRPS